MSMYQISVPPGERVSPLFHTCNVNVPRRALDYAILLGDAGTAGYWGLLMGDGCLAAASRGKCKGAVTGYPSFLSRDGRNLHATYVNETSQFSASRLRLGALHVTGLCYLRRSQQLGARRYLDAAVGPLEPTS